MSVLKIHGAKIASKTINANFGSCDNSHFIGIFFSEDNDRLIFARPHRHRGVMDEIQTICFVKTNLITL